MTYRLIIVLKVFPRWFWVGESRSDWLWFGWPTFDFGQGRGIYSPRPPGRFWGPYTLPSDFLLIGPLFPEIIWRIGSEWFMKVLGQITKYLLRNIKSSSRNLTLRSAQYEKWMFTFRLQVLAIWLSKTTKPWVKPLTNVKQCFQISMYNAGDCIKIVFHYFPFLISCVMLSNMLLQGQL